MKEIIETVATIITALSTSTYAFIISWPYYIRWKNKRAYNIIIPKIRKLTYRNPESGYIFGYSKNIPTLTPFYIDENNLKTLCSIVIKLDDPNIIREKYKEIKSMLNK